MLFTFPGWSGICQGNPILGPWWPTILRNHLLFHDGLTPPTYFFQRPARFWNLRILQTVKFSELVWGWVIMRDPWPSGNCHKIPELSLDFGRTRKKKTPVLIADLPPLVVQHCCRTFGAIFHASVRMWSVKRNHNSVPNQVESQQNSLRIRVKQLLSELVIWTFTHQAFELLM